MFTDGPENLFCSEQVRLDLCHLASSSLFINELSIANIVGKNIFLGWAKQWCSSNIPKNMSIGIAERIRYV